MRNVEKSQGNTKKLFVKTVPLPSHSHHHKDAKLCLKQLTEQHQKKKGNWNSLRDVEDVLPRPSC